VPACSRSCVSRPLRPPEPLGPSGGVPAKSVFKVRPPAQASHGDRTPSFAVMWCRLKCRTQKTAIYRDFPTGQADAGTQTPDPIITRYARCDREGAWLSEICSRNRLCVPRLCRFASTLPSAARRETQGVRTIPAANPSTVSRSACWRHWPARSSSTTPNAPTSSTSKASARSGDGRSEQIDQNATDYSVA
jgi:hypothetical protein